MSDFDLAWELYLKPACDRTKQHTKETIRAEVINGKAQCWRFPNSAMITSLWTYPSGRRSFQAWLAGGSFDEIMAFGDDGGPAEQFAREHECHEMRVIGRPGWARVRGWRNAGAILIRDLDA